MLQYIKVGQNPFWLNRYGADNFEVDHLDIQCAGVTLKIRERTARSNHLFHVSQQYIYAS